MLPGDDIQDLTYEWQRILRLQDWDIRTYFATPDELPDNEGNVLTWGDSKEAIVKVMHPFEVKDADSERDKNFPYDPEQILVHELLHIHLDTVTEEVPSDAERLLEEQAIELISKALVDLKRGIIRG